MGLCAYPRPKVASPKYHKYFWYPRSATRAQKNAIASSEGRRTTWREAVEVPLPPPSSKVQVQEICNQSVGCRRKLLRRIRIADSALELSRCGSVLRQKCRAPIVAQRAVETYDRSCHLQYTKLIGVGKVRKLHYSSLK
jgi:hypothetical protein